MFEGLFSQESLEQALSVLQTEVPFAIWETFYVTVLSTALAIVIGLPLGVLLVVGERAASVPFPPGS